LDGTSYCAKLGRVRDGFNSAQCYNEGGALFIILKYEACPENKDPSPVGR